LYESFGTFLFLIDFPWFRKTTITVISSWYKFFVFNVPFCCYYLFQCLPRTQKLCIHICITLVKNYAEFIDWHGGLMQICFLRTMLWDYFFYTLRGKKTVVFLSLTLKKDNLIELFLQNTLEYFLRFNLLFYSKFFVLLLL
jgi:hypothetical protein